MTVNRILLESYLANLRLYSFVEYHQSFAQDAAQNNQSYQDYLFALAQQEANERDRKREQQRIRTAKFPVLKDLSDFDFSAIPGLKLQRILDLARGEYLDKAQSIILVGNPGLGKTHIAIALALAACRQYHRVRFYNVAGLVNDLIKAQQAQELDKFLKVALRHHLIVLDELGFIPFSKLGSHLMFQFCSALHEQVSLIITTNLKFADWSEVFGDEKLTLALLDRLTHKAHIIEFIGDSYRFRQRLLLDGFSDTPLD
jgi:DNA replication protein DnaC